MLPQRKKKEKNSLVLKIKRGALFCLGFNFFFCPSQNWYLTVPLSYQLPPTRKVEFTLPMPAAYPLGLEKNEEGYFWGHFLVLAARSAVVIDRDSAVPLFQKEERTKLLPASTVKIMTALVALDYYRLDDILTVGEVSHQGQDMKLVPGEKISVENLLAGVLIASANDAALVLAQNYPGGEKGFVVAMNQAAERLNLGETHFANPTGLDSDERGNSFPDRSYTTALDLARLAARALKNEFLAKTVTTQAVTVSDLSGEISHPLYTINELLGRLPGIKGVKTGWTEEAGECLVGYVERDGHGLISVVLASDDRFGETAKLVDWAFANHTWESVTPVL